MKKEAGVSTLTLEGNNTAQHQAGVTDSVQEEHIDVEDEPVLPEETPVEPAAISQ